MKEQRLPEAANHRLNALDDASAMAMGEVYDRVVEVHYALASAGRVDEQLHHWCLDALTELLKFIDEVEGREAATSREHRT